MFDRLQEEFLYWVGLYYGVLNNLYGEDRDNAVLVLDEDEKFDRWFESYQRDQGNRAAGTRTSSPESGQKAMSKEDYLEKFNGVL